MFYVAIVLVLVGVGIRIAKSRQYLDLYARRYSSAPPKSWLWTRDPDPEIERVRRVLAVATVMVVVGLVLQVASLGTF